MEESRERYQRIGVQVEYIDTKDYQIIVVPRPYDSFVQSEEIRFLLSEVWKFKLEAHRISGMQGQLPIDQLDFLCHHIILCKKIDNKLIPQAAFKSLTQADCLGFSTDFPLRSMLLKGTEDFYQLFVNGLNEWTMNKRLHESAMTFGHVYRPKLQQEELSVVKRIMQTMLYFFYSTYHIPHVIEAIPNSFKLIQEYQKIGYSSLSFKSHILPVLKSNNFGGAEIQLMHLEEARYQVNFKANAEILFRGLWENRITLDRDHNLVNFMKKAA